MRVTTSQMIAFKPAVIAVVAAPTTAIVELVTAPYANTVGRLPATWYAVYPKQLVALLTLSLIFPIIAVAILKAAVSVADRSHYGHYYFPSIARHCPQLDYSSDHEFYRGYSSIFYLIV